MNQQVWRQGHADKNPNTLALPVIARSSEMPEDYSVEEHQHPWGQLAYASNGIMKVKTQSVSYIIPPEKALWLPPNTPHAVSTRYGLSFRSLYIDNFWSNTLPSITTALNVSGLLRELILHISDWPQNYDLTESKLNLIKVLINQIQSADRAPLFLNMPKDKRLEKISQTLIQQPANNTSLESWSQTIGATPRTLNRLFLKETQMGFVTWRQRLRILYSLERIERGDPITLIASDLGYESGSAFTNMFKKHLGKSPKQYFKEIKEGIFENSNQDSIESSS